MNSGQFITWWRRFLGVLFLTYGLMFLMASVVSADDCSSPADCQDTGWSAGLITGLGSTVLGWGIAVGGVPGLPTRPPQTGSESSSAAPPAAPPPPAPTNDRVYGDQTAFDILERMNLVNRVTLPNGNVVYQPAPGFDNLGGTPTTRIVTETYDDATGTLIGTETVPINEVVGAAWETDSEGNITNIAIVTREGTDVTTQVPGAPPAPPGGASAAPPPGPAPAVPPPVPPPDVPLVPPPDVPPVPPPDVPPVPPVVPPPVVPPPIVPPPVAPVAPVVPPAPPPAPPAEITPEGARDNILDDHRDVIPDSRETRMAPENFHRPNNADFRTRFINLWPGSAHLEPRVTGFVDRSDPASPQVYIRERGAIPGDTQHEMVHVASNPRFRGTLHRNLNEAATEYYTRQHTGPAGLNRAASAYGTRVPVITEMANAVGADVVSNAYFGDGNAPLNNLRTEVDRVCGAGTFDNVITRSDVGDYAGAQRLLQQRAPVPGGP